MLKAEFEPRTVPFASKSEKSLYRQCVLQCGMGPPASLSPSPATPPSSPAWTPSRGSTTHPCVSEKVHFFPICIYSITCYHISIISSVRSSSVYHGLLEGAAATFSNFSNSSDSKVKVKVKGPNMCYIFEKHWIQGYRI